MQVSSEHKNILLPFPHTEMPIIPLFYLLTSLQIYPIILFSSISLSLPFPLFIPLSCAWFFFVPLPILQWISQLARGSTSLFVLV